MESFSNESSCEQSLIKDTVAFSFSGVKERAEKNSPVIDKEMASMRGEAVEREELSV